MQFQVPQNITMEDKIIGPFTPIQFGIITVGGLLAFTLFTSTTLPEPINKLSGGILAVITLALAVGKFNDQPLFRFFPNLVSFAVAPKIRVWHKSGQAVTIVQPNPVTQSKKEVRVAKNIKRGDIARLAAVLDSRGTIGASPTASSTQPPPP